MDPRIRDYVFLPLVILMFSMQFLRIMGMRYMNEPKNKLLERARLAYTTLVDTLFDRDCDRDRRLPDEPIDIQQILDEGTPVDAKEMQALNRSKRIRKMHEFLPESAVKTRKAFFCHDKDGYLAREVKAPNPMNLANPDMMNNMLKSNIQGVVHMFMFTAIGNVFQGFITAQVPFPLGFKFKQMLQQGLQVPALDPTYVSSMSWAFLLVYGLNGVLAMMLADQKTIEEMELMQSGAGMMQQQNAMQ